MVSFLVGSSTNPQQSGNPLTRFTDFLCDTRRHGLKGRHSFRNNLQMVSTAVSRFGVAGSRARENRLQKRQQSSLVAPTNCRLLVNQVFNGSTVVAALKKQLVFRSITYHNTAVTTAGKCGYCCGYNADFIIRATGCGISPY